MSNDPATGPLTHEELASLAAAPYGAATKRIRQFDPMWGRAPDADIEWKVTFERESVQTGIAVIKAKSEDDAIAKAEEIKSSEISWDDPVAAFDDFSVMSATVLAR